MINQKKKKKFMIINNLISMNMKMINLIKEKNHK